MQNLPEDIKSLFTFLKLMLFLVIGINIQACIWYTVVLINSDKELVYDGVGRSAQWYPPTEWLNYSDSTFFKEGRWHTYIECFYHSILMIGLNEMGPVNPEEMLACVLSLLVASFINANLFGEMAVLIANLNKKVTLRQSKLDSANHVMKSLKLPDERQDEIREYF